MNRAIVATLFLLLCPVVAQAGDLQVGPVRVDAATHDPEAKTVAVTVDVRWTDSWRGATTGDAVWLFAKFERAPGVWADLRFAPDGLAATGPTPLTVEAVRLPAGYANGLLVRRASNGKGDVEGTIRTQWHYGASGFEWPATEVPVRAVAEACSGAVERLVAVSSSDVYRNYDGWRGESTHDPDPVPLAEDAPLRETRYPYRGYDDLDFAYAEDYDKVLVEQVVMDAADLTGTVLRLPAVYGPGDAQGRIAPYLRRMVDNRPAILLDERQADWRWTHGYFENVGAAVAAAATNERATGRVYNVGEAETPTTAERVRQLAEVVGWNGEVVPLPEDNLPVPLQAPFDWRYELATDTRRLRDDLEYAAPVGADEALRRTAEWLRANDQLGPTPDYDAEDRALARW